MIIEILFNEVCNLYGDGQNVKYLQATLPDAEFIFTSLNDTPYFAENKPDLVYIGCMGESVQRRVIRKLQPLLPRLRYLIDENVPILATGNAGEIFCKKIEYVTEKVSADGLGVFDLTVKTDLFDRYNGKVLGELNDMKIVGFRSQFSMAHGDNSSNYFLKCIRGDGINRQSKLEGYRINNLICTNTLGPILALNPHFCEYLIGLTGRNVTAAYKEAAMNAYNQRVKEFEDPSTEF